MVAFRALGSQGRLGNQLFQIAATVALATRHRDTYRFPPWPYTPHFGLQKCFAMRIEATAEYVEPGFAYQPIPYQPGLDLSGYFQSEKHFSDCALLIRRLLSPRPRARRRPGTVSLHVRRGDYVGASDRYVTLGMDYYERALARVTARRVLVFSDDLAWCRRTLRGSRFSFADGHHPWEDLALMASCGAHVIANSSFSWWGAWLDPDPDAVVVAPEAWFGPTLAATHSTADLVPERWLRV